jgi:hypothetical protein
VDIWRPLPRGDVFRIWSGALAGTFVLAISNPGRCRSVKLCLLTGQHTDLYTTRASVHPAQSQLFNLRACVKWLQPME